jgi:hypothetical protein
MNQNFNSINFVYNLKMFSKDKIVKKKNLMQFKMVSSLHPIQEEKFELIATSS